MTGNTGFHLFFLYFFAKLLGGRHLSYQRGKRNTTPGTSLIQIEGVNNTEAANFYCGKKVAFVYRASKEVRGSKIRVIWGKIARPHGMRD
ncbi:hypothetical protein SS1G_12885 [Sclerotinia sclerotiorum 1980 UF-70]|uniref:60S ribosomal protein L33-A n=1 Tax=Sclerotinia sclerotiorum (strain ATCC 18683 / 1980 / Ss-1) TaxID=665079 RepID=A7F5K7_SCLS1|nr:hypothetical protein SS1G_12885 [Sclerotinia sclerotiorum 1980 UF-70]EDN98028.1 hypothetical protein SS1G_12885 [Sclerotinia sclerotiorum 1980 UF-70]